ncbi:uncharacterized protein LOC133889977 [Phragmites australis]|uniref:uncharacterized protein LOC133889977 n=1 Tax=Phragmites australis TaxID=29695 RepID=UPI002D783280|nr:uncharacterized protein LOC133889977 [Phragmites australis]
MSSCVYSSEAAAWSDTTSVENSDNFIVDMMPAALVGNTLYFNSQQSRGRIVEYDFGAPRRLSFINPPSFRYLLGTVLSPYLGGTVLMPSEGGGLGFASMHRSCLHLWAREAGPNGTAAWAQQGYIELATLLPEHALRRADAVGFVEGLGVIFVSTDDGVFIIELKSHRVGKVSSWGSIYAAIPYMSFYTPDLLMG